MGKVSANTAYLKQNYHQTFEVRQNGRAIIRHTLLLNPQNLSQNEQGRSSITQTLGGAYITDFGSGLIAVNISGTTGYKSRTNQDGETRDGFEEFIHFRNEVFRKFIQTNDPDYSMFWYNWEDEEYWKIQPNTFRLQRNVSESLLYRYEFSFTCIAQAIAGSASGDYIGVDFPGLGRKLTLTIANISEVMANFS